MMSSRLELFVDDLPASIHFYQQLLGFSILKQEANGYTVMHLGPVQIALNLRASLPKSHPFKHTRSERPIQGIEWVLEVDDLEAVHQKALAQPWPLTQPLKRHSWGQSDFCLLDPAGLFLRISSKA